MQICLIYDAIVKTGWRTLEIYVGWYSNCRKPQNQTNVWACSSIAMQTVIGYQYQSR